MTARTERQRALAELIRGEPLGSQEEVTERLRAMGHAVTQATVSRDLDQLGAVKVKRGGTLAYTLADRIGDGDWAAQKLDRILAEWVESVQAAGNLIVLRTPPGSAHLVALALDQAALGEVAGTIAGDDTLFVALRNGVNPATLATRFRKMAKGAGES